MTRSEMVALGDPLFTSPKTSEVGKRQVISTPLHKWVEWGPGLSANHPTDLKRCQCPCEIAGECVKVDPVPGISSLDSDLCPQESGTEADFLNSKQWPARTSHQ